MKAKYIVRFLGIIIVILFFALYFGQYTGYYNISNERKTTLTKEAIERFERDVSDGKEIIAGNYLTKEKNYNNNLSKMGLGISRLIGEGFDKMINTIFKEVEKAIRNWSTVSPFSIFL